MQTFYIHGKLLCLDEITICEKDKKLPTRLVSEFILSQCEKLGLLQKGDRWYDDQEIVIPNCNIRIYVTESESTLDEAMATFDKMLYSDEFNVVGADYGYSEWTISGFDVKKFRIGNHDLNRELKRYDKKYVHFIMEV